MDIDKYKTEALSCCVEIATNFEKEEVTKFFPPLVQKAWEVGDAYLCESIKESRKKRKNFVL